MTSQDPDQGSARDQILGSIRRSLGRPTGNAVADQAAARTVDARLARPDRNLIPDRTAGLQADGLVDLFRSKCREAACTVEDVASLADVPMAVQAYLARENLPARLIQAPAFAEEASTENGALDWSAAPTLEVTAGHPTGSEDTSLTPVLAAIAETGTMMLTSAGDTPTGLNFLPENHIAVVRRSQVVGPLEDAWARFRSAHADMPRTVNLITGPSRTGDIEQKIQMGAHGPRRLHVILVAD